MQESKKIPISMFILITVFSLFLVNCHRDFSKERILFDFESDSELDQLHWTCHTLYFLSNEHSTHGSKSLKLELYPSSDYPGLTPVLNENDWRGYKGLCFDVYNPQENKVQLFVGIDDQKDYPDYAYRYNKSFILMPGMNHISILLNAMVTSGTKRNLNLRKIEKLLIFMAHPEKKVVLYVDYIRLVR